MLLNIGSVETECCASVHNIHAHAMLVLALLYVQRGTLQSQFHFCVSCAICYVDASVKSDSRFADASEFIINTQHSAY